MPTDLVAKLRAFHTVAGRSTAAPPSPPALHDLLGGHDAPTPEGDCFVVERAYPLAHRHGALELGHGFALTGLTRQLLAHLAGGPFDPGSALFLDTETTGLAGGTGTYAFLVGLGYRDGDRFLVRQLFLRHPAHEPALLHALGTTLARFATWVTFNGKAFDAPLLATRFQCVRREPLPAPARHLDLLPLARRLWRTRLPSCALGVLERALLSVERGDDIPSWRIPEAYFAYVHRGEAAVLPAIFAHNAADILSMAALLGYCDAAIRAPHSHANRLDPLALVRLLHRVGLVHDALAWGEAALAALPADEQRPLRWELARLHYRHGAAAMAVAHWRALATGGGPWAVRAFEALARHYERRERDYAAAQRVTAAALTALHLCPGAASPMAHERLERRLARLWFRSRLAARSR
ncbi:MAG TPA: ribonuclease H-like domain-containing protein [Chloroflexota bacterium]|nr:ribonuclease H-like domain-containing protein [Chloroflexota bacterium]